MCEPVRAATAPPEIVDVLLARGWTIAMGESLTAGMVAASLAGVPGCSAVLRGAVVAYQPDIKADLLGVPQAALDEGVVSAPVAIGLARGACRLLGAQVGIGTTGAAGPDPHDGAAPGRVWIAVSTPIGESTRRLDIAGGRDDVRCQTVAACWDLLGHVLAEDGNTHPSAAVGS